jgi:hypothetical protein
VSDFENSTGIYESSSATRKAIDERIAAVKSANTIRTGYTDNEGNLWFSSNKGVYLYNGDSFTNLTTRDGLSDNQVTSIMQDSDDNMWFGMPDGMCRYDGENFTHIPVPYTEISSSWLDTVYPVVNPNQVTIIKPCNYLARAYHRALIDTQFNHLSLQLCGHHRRDPSLNRARTHHFDQQVVANNFIPDDRNRAKNLGVNKEPESHKKNDEEECPSNQTQHAFSFRFKNGYSPGPPKEPATTSGFKEYSSPMGILYCTHLIDQCLPCPTRLSPQFHRYES